MGRDITLCHPKLQQLAEKLVEECAKQGLKIKVTECLRSVAEQDALYAQGRTAPGNIVTNARGSSYSSLHMWGVAFDICRNDGKGAYENKDNFFQKVGAIGKKIGLEWGGDWKSIVDLPHFQLPDWGSTSSKLKSLYGNPEAFKKTWKPALPTFKVGQTVTCTVATYVRDSVGGEKTLWTAMSDKLKTKCVKNGKYGQFKVGETFKIAELKTTVDTVYGKLNGGSWLCLYGNGEKRFK